MTIKVNQDLCTGCGTCVALCPDVFKLNSDSGKLEVVSSAFAKAMADKQDNVDCAKNALASCPVQAISID